MKISILLFLTIFSTVVYGETTVINTQFDFDDFFILNGENFTLNFYGDSEKLFVKSKYLKLIMLEGDCDTKGFYKYCLKNVTNDDYELDFFFNFEVIELSCTNQTKLQYEDECKFKFGHNCTIDDECASGTCYNELCTFTTPICGDDVCDNKERCDEDCLVIEEVNLTINETLEINISINETNSSLELNDTAEINETTKTVEWDTDEEQQPSKTEKVVGKVVQNLPELEDKKLNPVPKMKPLTWVFILLGIIVVAILVLFITKYMRKDSIY